MEPFFVIVTGPPMYYFPVSLMPKGNFVMCWVCGCGHSYNKPLGFSICVQQGQQQNALTKTHAGWRSVQTKTLQVAVLWL